MHNPATQKKVPRAIGSNIGELILEMLAALECREKGHVVDTTALCVKLATHSINTIALKLTSRYEAP